MKGKGDIIRVLHVSVHFHHYSNESRFPHSLDFIGILTQSRIDGGLRTPCPQIKQQGSNVVRRLKTKELWVRTSEVILMRGTHILTVEPIQNTNTWIQMYSLYRLGISIFCVYCFHFLLFINLNTKIQFMFVLFSSAKSFAEQFFLEILTCRIFII